MKEFSMFLILSIAYVWVVSLYFKSYTAKIETYVQLSKNYNYVLPQQY